MDFFFYSYNYIEPTYKIINKFHIPYEFVKTHLKKRQCFLLITNINPKLSIVSTNIKDIMRNNS